MTGIGMAAEEEIEYESDPEEAKLSLKMRRRVASDDEAEEGSEIRVTPRRRDDDSDGESEGAVAEYEDEFEEEVGEEVYGLDEEEIELVGYVESGGGREEGNGNAAAVELAAPGTDGGAMGELMEEKVADDDAGEFSHENEGAKHEGEKKEMEPYAVPTAGAFYMHDDRFRENAGGRNRRTLGGRRLWESKDDRKWGHDKFEELTMHERSYNERKRGSRGRYRGRGMNRSVEREYYQENRTTVQANYTNQNINGQNNSPKVVRGRGPRRYQPSLNNKEMPLTQNKQAWKSVEKPSYVSSARTSGSMSNREPDMVRPRTQIFASNLNIASPPFYPSGSSTKDDNIPSKRNIKDGSINRNGQPSVTGENFIMEQSSKMLRGKNIVDSIGVDRLYIDDSHSAMADKPANTKQMPTQQQMRVQGRGMASFARMAYQPVGSNNQVNRGNPSNQLQTFQTSPGQTRAQSSVQASGQQFIQRVPSGLQAASTSKVNAVESELDTPPGSNKSKTTLVPIGQGGGQGSGRGSFFYGGAQVLGTSGNTNPGDQNFPAFFPVMQFGAQHPGGMGVPAVGMAFPGYVGQPQNGVGNSEMTWLPILAGAAGALGARYCPPYVSADGTLHAHSSGQMSSTTDVSR
ncbi:hypothetical protein ACS0TY_012488 [Phlomoides rotata]